MKIYIKPCITKIPDVFDKLQHYLSKTLELVLEEALVNIITHAHLQEHDTIGISCSVDEETVSIALTDKGVSFNPTTYIHKASSTFIGGAGLRLIHAYTDSIDYKREDNHNILTLISKRPKSALCNIQ